MRGIVGGNLYIQSAMYFNTPVMCAMSQALRTFTEVNWSPSPKILIYVIWSVVLEF